MSNFFEDYNNDPSLPRPPSMFRGKEYPFEGVVDLCWLHNNSVAIGSSSILYSERKLTKECMMASGIYWVVATGSWWACYDGDVFHMPNDDKDLGWSPGTKPPNYLDKGWSEYLTGINVMHFPRSWADFTE